MRSLTECSPTVVRADDESARESQQPRLNRSHSAALSARRRRVGAGVSTWVERVPRRSGPRARRRRVGRESQRANVDAAFQAAYVRADDESARESQLQGGADRRHAVQVRADDESARESQLSAPDLGEVGLTVRADDESARESQLDPYEDAVAVAHVRADDESARESQRSAGGLDLDADEWCAPTTSRRGSLNKFTTLGSTKFAVVRADDESARESQLVGGAEDGVEGACAPTTSRRGSLNHPQPSPFGPFPHGARRRRVGAGVSTRRRPVCPTRNGSCAPTTSRRGSLNTLPAIGAHLRGDVRADDESARESQLRRRCGGASQRPGARRRRVGAGVSTRRRPVCPTRNGSCAPTTSRRGSLNIRPRPSRTQTGRCAPTTSRRGSLNLRRWRTGTTSRRCAPTTSRRGSLNIRAQVMGQLLAMVRADDESARESQRISCAPRRTRRSSARRRRVGAGVSTSVPDVQRGSSVCARRRRVGAGVSTRSMR